MTDIDEAFWAIGRSDFMLLTTFRRNGVGVATTVWVTRHEDHLVVTTPATSGKVKRLRHDERVLLAPCGRLGRVRLGAPVVHGRAHVLGPDDEHPGAVTALRRDYGLQYRLVLAVERAVRRRRGGDGARVIIALEPAA